MAIKLNENGFAYAQQLIQQGRIDRDGDWEENKPSAELGNAFLKNYSFQEFGNWFLGENTEANPETKERYEFPYGNFKKLYKSGLVAIEQRAAQYKHEEIKDAARRLLDIIG